MSAAAAGAFQAVSATRRKLRPRILRKAIKKVRLHRPVTICTDKAPTYRKVIRNENRHYDPQFDSIIHIDKKWRNNRIESDHAVLKLLLGYWQSFRSLSSAKTTLRGIEAMRMIKNNHIDNMKPGVQGKIAFVHELFHVAA